MKRRQRGLVRRWKTLLYKMHPKEGIRYGRVATISYDANPIDFQPIVHAYNALRFAEGDAVDRNDKSWLFYHTAADHLRDRFDLHGERA